MNLVIVQGWRAQSCHCLSRSFAALWSDDVAAARGAPGGPSRRLRFRLLPTVESKSGPGADAELPVEVYLQRMAKTS